MPKMCQLYTKTSLIKFIPLSVMTCMGKPILEKSTASSCTTIVALKLHRGLLRDTIWHYLFLPKYTSGVRRPEERPQRCLSQLKGYHHHQHGLMQPSLWARELNQLTLWAGNSVLSHLGSDPAKSLMPHLLLLLSCLAVIAMTFSLISGVSLNPLLGI